MVANPFELMAERSLDWLDRLSLRPMTSFFMPLFQLRCLVSIFHQHIILRNCTFHYCDRAEMWHQGKTLVNNIESEKAKLSRMSDYLQKLPTELQLAILCYLPDLPCLYRLSCASWSMNAVFESRPIEILEAIMSFLTPDLRFLMRANAVASASTLIDIATLDAGFHHDKYRREHTNMSLKLQDCVNPLPPTLPLASAQQLVLMSCRIEDLAVSFFNTYLTRFNRIENESMPSPKPESDHSLSQDDTSRPRGKATFTPTAIRSIGWCEYYRVICSLWQIQISFSTCDLSTMRSQWSKMVAEADRLIRYTQLTDKRAPWEQDTIACVKEFLEEEEKTLMNTSLKHLQKRSDIFHHPYPISIHPASDRFTLA